MTLDPATLPNALSVKNDGGVLRVLGARSIDFAEGDLLGGKVIIPICNVEAGTYVAYAVIYVVTAFDDANDLASIGDGTLADGYIQDMDIQTAADVSESSQNSATAGLLRYGGGKFYSVDDTVDCELETNSGTTAGEIVCVVIGAEGGALSGLTQP